MAKLSSCTLRERWSSDKLPAREKRKQLSITSLKHVIWVRHKLLPQQGRHSPQVQHDFFGMGIWNSPRSVWNLFLRWWAYVAPTGSALVSPHNTMTYDTIYQVCQWCVSSSSLNFSSTVITSDYLEYMPRFVCEVSAGYIKQYIVSTFHVSHCNCSFSSCNLPLICQTISGIDRNTIDTAGKHAIAHRYTWEESTARLTTGIPMF